MLLVFFVCMAAAVVLQAAWGTLLCAERAVAEESLGRQRLGEKDEVLSLLVQRALEHWEPLDWTPLGRGDGALTRVAAEDDWLLQARARQDPSLSLGETSAWIERGRDGVDLPMAAVVADSLTAADGRSSLCVGSEEDSAEAGGATGVAVAECFLHNTPVGLLLAPGCDCLVLPSVWRLDAGWAALVASAPRGVACAEGVALLNAATGLTESLPAEIRGSHPDEPTLIVLTGGATLDARDRGDLYGVLVVDAGSVLLDGTVVHGAVFASGTVALGATGQIRFARDVLRWATDRSLKRARLIPGTRKEGTK